MLKLKKYLKPFIGGVILSILLLFIQAMADLNLPNYMSDIVNIGIQQEGIEHSSADKMSQDAFKFMSSFMTDEDKEILTKSYELSDGVYVLKKVDVDTRASLDLAFGKAAWTFINLMKNMPTGPGGQSTGSTSAGFDKIQEVDASKLYQIIPILEKLPPSMLIEAQSAAESMDELMLKQSGVFFTKAFYKELDVDMAKYQSSYIFKIGILMLLVALIGGIATVIVSLLSSRIAAGVSRNLRNDIFNKIENFSSNEFDKFSSASLITRCTNDVMQIQMLLMMGIRLICYAPIMGIGGIVMAVNKSVSMSWIILLSVTVLLGLIMIIMAIAVPKFKKIQKLMDKLNLAAREALTGLPVIRAFATQDFEKKKFAKANSELTDTMLFVSKILVFMMPAMMFIMNGVSLLVIWVGAHQVAESVIRIGDMMAFMQYLMQIIISFLMISMMFIFIPRASVSGERIAEVLSTEAIIKDPENPVSFPDHAPGLVEFKNVCFRYSNASENAVCNINFSAKPGQTTAIIGATGAGKSTLANLLVRFYDVSEGQITIDGIDIRDITQHDLRSRIGYIPQQGMLLAGSIKDNISYGSGDLSDDELLEIATTAQALSFINEKEDAFNSEISQGGTNVSGGQKQRLSIARALAVKPDIYIFDDSFSALDFKTDSALRKALKKRTATSTVIIIAQRINTIMNAERIIVLDDGRIVGDGTHSTLLESCAEYAEIAASQLSKEV